MKSLSVTIQCDYSNEVDITVESMYSKTCDVTY